MFRVSTLDLSNLPLNKGGGTDFSQDFFGRETFLTVSGQLNVEGYCLSMSNVYTFGPTFRAENSNTSRHLAEFWMVEPEIAFADLDNLADLAEDFLKYIFAAVLEECPDDMAFFAQRIEPEAINRLTKFTEVPFVRLDYEKAIEILKNASQDFEFPVEWGLDLQTEHERYLTEQHFKAPVIVMNYPTEIKAFYMRLSDDGRTVAALDVLAPGVKKTGCSGWAYTVQLAEDIQENDIIFENDGVKIVISQENLGFLDGSEIDFVAEGLSMTFQFNNPNVTEECGCGESFTIE